MSVGLSLDDPAYFDRLAQIESRHWWALGMWRLASHWLDRALAGRTELRALDVGCGTGLTSARLAGRRELAVVVGLEPDAGALAHARGRHAGPLVRGSALALPFASGTFDLVTVFDVLQHTDARAALYEFHRVLAPGGQLLVRVNGRGWTGDAATYTRPRLVDQLRGAGFEVQRTTYANLVGAAVQEFRGGLGRVLSRRRHGPAGHPGGGGLTIALPKPWINGVMGGVAAVEAALAGPFGLPLPFGHTTLALAERPAG